MVEKGKGQSAHVILPACAKHRASSCPHTALCTAHVALANPRNCSSKEKEKSIRAGNGMPPCPHLFSTTTLLTSPTLVSILY